MCAPGATQAVNDAAWLCVGRRIGMRRSILGAIPAIVPALWLTAASVGGPVAPGASNAAATIGPQLTIKSSNQTAQQRSTPGGAWTWQRLDDLVTGQQAGHGANTVFVPGMRATLMSWSRYSSSSIAPTSPPVTGPSVDPITTGISEGQTIIPSTNNPYVPPEGTSSDPNSWGGPHIPPTGSIPAPGAALLAIIGLSVLGPFRRRLG